MPKFDLNLLNSFVNENEIELVGEYDKLNRQSIINGKCKTCQNKNTQKKLKATNLIKYGCEYNLDNQEVKKKRTNTFLEKYGGHPSANEDIKQKKKRYLY